ncbi:MAG TPA: hypothetical protein PKN33_06980 [Phycisphaerae bacterium]|nr:hypothetical protein [Phycisphaerae bacterium]
MVAPATQHHESEPDPMQQAIPQSPTGMGAHGWSRMIVGIILLGALTTVVIRGIYVISTLEDESPVPTQTDSP